MKKISVVCILFFCCKVVSQNYTRQDSLRGSITEERVWWDLKQYQLKVDVDLDRKTIKGANTIVYTVLKKNNLMQIDLQPPMKIDQIVQDGHKLKFKSEGNAHFISLEKTQTIGSDQKLTVFFSGKPPSAKNAPWDGGFSWSKDTNETHFIATSNQGIGASLWWPNKDHYYDEPEQGIDIHITIPTGLMAVANGRLINQVTKKDKTTWSWKVVNPINNYGVNINIGDYIHFGEKYVGEKGILDMDYYVLKANETKAREQFKQVPKMMEAFEYWFGPYPFYEDSFKLVEVPYLGMEHQSSVTYGNQYRNGYLGSDLSGTGWGLKFDFIIIHESGHEWFANNITHIDVADMWIHEGFTAYSENLYLDYFYGNKAAADYVIGTRMAIQNDRPIIGVYEVNQEGSTDMYYKGANILHTLRQLINDDKKWRKILRGLNRVFYHQTVSSKQIEEYISKESGINLTEFWEQYLRTVQIPILEYKKSEHLLSYRYTNTIENFRMPVIAIINGEEKWIYPSDSWKSDTYADEIKTLKIKDDFYINPIEIN